ncbi:hypothetical protein [Pseudonocardia sp. KRD291]|uniref:hypothetical protein n=1 Tax=Pseudonocardia sp. KRD291 TaxID=2792007 RepID=UPI001C49DC23|nr:hypothetical protein [Pseudonocardia sp. KRD291]MBW0102281.1 hypothetical protein [Pseudonocardia sp. KRD291]
MDSDTASQDQAARSSAVGDLLTALDRIGRRYPAGGSGTDRHRGADAERITAEVARHLTIARVRLAATALPPDQDRSFTYGPAR